MMLVNYFSYYHVKFDNLMLSSNFKSCIGAEVEVDNSAEIWIWYSYIHYVKMSQWIKPLFSCGSGGGIPRLQEVEVLGQNIFLKNASNIYGLVSFDSPPPPPPLTICIMLYTCSYISFLMAAIKMISFNE